MSNTPLVAIVMGSISDKEALMPAKEILDLLEIPCISRVISAHRTPHETAHFANNAEKTGLKIIIAGAGAAAALPGTIAAHTSLPVIGVPLNATPLLGLDALMAIVQMPGSTPVATMAIGPAGAKNAALLAGRILSLIYPTIKERLEKYQEAMYQKALLEIEREVFQK